MTDLELFRIRIALVQAFLEEKGYDGVLLNRTDNFAMATGGKRSYINCYTDAGANGLFVHRSDGAFFVGNNIERPRILDEELNGFGCGVVDFLWFESTAAKETAKRFSGNLVSDDGSLGKNIHGELAYLRALLTETELERYRELGGLGVEAMMTTLDAIHPGMKEADIVAMLVAEGAKRRCHVPVALAAADERIGLYRHPLPTVTPFATGGLDERGVDDYVMVVGCFIHDGLVLSLTRFKQVAPIPESTLDAFTRICAVDVRMQQATEPGKTLGDVCTAFQAAYVEFGFPADEWHNHHQGGATGYAGRTAKGTPGQTFPILDLTLADKVREKLGVNVTFGHAFAWNPSAKGVKSEDTFLLWEGGRKEIVTATPDIPSVDVNAIMKGGTDIVKSGIAPASYWEAG